MEWQSDITAQDLKEGDIIETPSKFPSDHPLFPDMVVPFVKHYAIVVRLDGKLMVVHNTIGNHPSMDTIENLLRYRGISRVKRTGVSSEEILKRFNECKDTPYSFGGFNCEDAMTLWSGCDMGFDQRNGFAILTSVVIVIILVLIFGGIKQIKQ